MKSIKNAFSLIELIVWITISMVLMVSVGIFISSWMQNIFTQQKILENTSNFTDFSSNLLSTFNLLSTWSFAAVNTWSGIIFKREQYFWEWWFSYIWTEKLDWVYCDSDSEETITNSIFIKNFIAFEENWEDIFNDYDIILKSKLSGIYQSFQKEHVIRNLSGDIIIWKWIFWNKFEEWVSWTDIYLNSPTWLAINWNILYISDTLNNRILYYDIIWDKIHTLLDENDGLNEPTGLYYNDFSLYISNSWNWEILKYSSKSSLLNPDLTMNWFSENINEIHLSFSWSNSPNLTNQWNWTVTNNSSVPNYSTWTSDELKYYFVTKNPVSIQASCLWTETKFLNGKPSLYCVNTWSWQTTNYPLSNVSEIRIDSLLWLSNTWSYYVNLKLFNWSTERYSEYFPYFTQSDNDLTTAEDNTLTTLYSWLEYPTWIWWITSSDYNEFWDWWYLDIAYSTGDTLLWTPVKNLEITNIPSDIISIFLKYYKNYNCYNLDDKSERSFFLKKNLK